MFASTKLSPNIFGRLGGLLPVVAAAGLLAFTPLALAQTAPPAAPLPPEAGLWFDDTGDGAVEITPCGRNLLCGRIVWLKEPINAEGVPKHDKYNPDPSLRARPICGLPILANLQLMTDGTYDNGQVYDPKKGSQHDAAIKLLRADKLQLTGFGLGRLLSKSFVWTRAPADLPLCTGSPAKNAAGTAAPMAAPVKPKAAAPGAANAAPASPPAAASTSTPAKPKAPASDAYKPPAPAKPDTRSSVEEEPQSKTVTDQKAVASAEAEPKENGHTVTKTDDGVTVEIEVPEALREVVGSSRLSFAIQRRL